MPDPERKSRRRRPTNIVARLALPALYAAVAPHLPVRHWLVDLPASFCVQAGVVLLAVTLVMLLARRWWLATFFGLGVLAAGLAIVPPWFAATREPATTGQPLTVMALNLLREGKAHAPRALAEIERVDPDVLFLSEVTPEWRRILEPRLGAWPHRTVREDSGWFGVGLYSKRPFASAEVIPLAYEWAPAVRAVVSTEGGPLGVLAVHTPRPGRGRRCAERDAAMAQIAEALEPMPSRRVVLGDFNCTPWNRAFPAMLEATGLHHTSGDRFRPTWPAQWPWPLRVPIDHLLVGGEVAVERVGTGEYFGSDHLPVWAVVRL